MNNLEEYKWGMFYYNKDDRNFLAKKASGLGWTINFAHKMAVASSVILLALVAYLLLQI